jgi:hypothetical protein
MLMSKERTIKLIYTKGSITVKSKYGVTVVPITIPKSIVIREGVSYDRV